MRLRRSPAVAAAVVAALAVAGAAVLVGRWELHRDAARQNARMLTVLRTVGDIRTRAASGYRVGDPSCLAYPRPDNKFALQLCFDAQGRLVETVDRRGIHPIYASLTYEPSLAATRFPSSLIDRLLTQTAKQSERR